MITKDDMISALSVLGIEIGEINELNLGRITRFELTPAKGFKTAACKTVLDKDFDEDLGFNLMVKPSYIRVIASKEDPKIVIELPKEEQKFVSLLPLLESEEFKSNSFELPIVLGKTFENEVVTFDLCDMPHLLMAGSTGQGKTECLHTIITSLICSHRNIRLALFAPKTMAFERYENLPKSLFFASEGKDTSVISSLEDAKHALQNLNDELERRYDLLRAAGAKNIREYNELMDTEDRRLPYIVSVIDEFGDYVMALGNEIEHPLSHITQLGRAVGIYSIISTQRPSYNIISGKIKANYPARMAFRMSSAIDSRTLLDCQAGAEKLLGCGDMLFQPKHNELIRLQCAYIPEDEFEYIVKERNE